MSETMEIVAWQFRWRGKEEEEWQDWADGAPHEWLNQSDAYEVQVRPLYCNEDVAALKADNVELHSIVARLQHRAHQFPVLLTAPPRLMPDAELMLQAARAIERLMVEAALAAAVHAALKKEEGK